MKFTGILLVIAASVLSSEAIRNGQNFQNAPYMTRLQYLIQVGGLGGQGGGSVISHRHILTSAFVLNTDFAVLNIWIGGITRSTQRQVFPSRRIRHMSYTQNPRTNDIGIIFLTADIVFDRFVQPIALPPAGSLGPYLNEQSTMLGFGGFPGNTTPENLSAAFMRVVTATRCNSQFPAHVVNQQFCAEDTHLRSDICSNDIGGPVVNIVRGVEVLTGISSTERCLENTIASQPSLFMRVAPYRAWIQTEAGV